MSDVRDDFMELAKLIDEAGLKLTFGLKAQGHVPTIREMLANGDDWNAIGKAIGWCPKTAREYWDRYEGAP